MNSSDATKVRTIAAGKHAGTGSIKSTFNLLAFAPSPFLEIAQDVCFGYSRFGHFSLQTRSKFFKSFSFCLGPLAADRKVMADNIAMSSNGDDLIFVQEKGGEFLAELANADFLNSHDQFALCTDVYTIVE
jgi:hypothetical protein